mmetsp:Transcript_21516/g.42940  ORF Transcript_21516/g.42940 Transcript_21516/m.42940 type:complete len:208 (-) Transcript_21516:1413-2036(-)
MIARARGNVLPFILLFCILASRTWGFRVKGVNYHRHSLKHFEQVKAAASSSARRSLVGSLASLSFLTGSSSSPALAAVAAGRSKADASAACSSIRSALAQLQGAKKLVDGKKFDELLALLDDSSDISSFETTITTLLQSKVLDPEDSRAIGTIRTYGIAADVMIMTGGLKAELKDNDEPNPAEVAKFYKRAIDSLKEINLILNNSGL